MRRIIEAVFTKRYYFLMVLSLFISACNPMMEKQEEIEAFMIQQHVDNLSKHLSQKETELPFSSDLQPSGYRYQTPLKNPFKVSYFSLPQGVYTPTENEVKTPTCQSTDCLPIKKVKRSLLESYNLNVLRFVGTIGSTPLVGLIKTPDSGVVQVEIGDYMGQNDGKVIAIGESQIVLREKFYKSGVWETKRTVLSMTR